jgi:hypothetical protein
MYILINFMVGFRAFLQYHSINEQDASSLIHDEFPNWLKAYVSVIVTVDVDSR